ncbi:leucyl aminopeptidase [Desulfosediminicola ganghwensis]|uniref:leucyl aminopeptidase n=1 Tax=Desulfosediminicola ganghwensis TaxID=2569540 RepID=UPI0010AD7192|nr:leucyl aminopeptidase [Desulfosediminicola ganghwensis]
MHKTKVAVSEKNINLIKGGLLIFFAIQGEDDAVVCSDLVLPYLDSLLELKDFKAGANERVILYPSQIQVKDKKRSLLADRLMVVGLGKLSDQEEHLRIEAVRSAGGTISKACETLKVKDVKLVCDDIVGMERAAMAHHLVEGVVLGDYRFKKYKKEDPDTPTFEGISEITVCVDTQAGKVRKSVAKAISIAHAVHSARNMANEPGNSWTATDFADYALKLAEEKELTCRIIDKPKMKKLGLRGILAVNQGSAEPPKLVILEYSPAKKKKSVMLVGKGLTFDSGGVSLKPAAGMQNMKMDMCGGAAVLATMQAIADLKPDVHVIALIPATDNMSGSSALKPGDVIRHYNDVTAEIVNTDAEGRIILGDALAYGIEKYEPDCVIDVATLTGAVIIGLGHHHSGVLGNDDQLVDGLIDAGQTCSEPLWRLPLTKEYEKQIESDVADIKNTGGRDAGTITAAAYLKNFVGDTPWAHLDIAGTAWDFTEKSYIPKGPSGIAVRTLTEFICKK